MRLLVTFNTSLSFGKKDFVWVNSELLDHALLDVCGSNNDSLYRTVKFH